MCAVYPAILLPQRDLRGRRKVDNTGEEARFQKMTRLRQSGWRSAICSWIAMSLILCGVIPQSAQISDSDDSAVLKASHGNHAHLLTVGKVESPRVGRPCKNEYKSPQWRTVGGETSSDSWEHRVNAFPARSLRGEETGAFLRQLIAVVVLRI